MRVNQSFEKIDRFPFVNSRSRKFLKRPQGKQLWKWTVLETFERLVEDKHIKRLFFYLHFASFASYILIMKCLFVLLAIVAVALAQGELIKSRNHGGK